MGSLSNLYISQSYTSLIHLGSDTTITTASVELQDGLGNGIGVFVNSLGNVSITGILSASNIPADIASQAELNAYTASTNARLNNIESTTASLNISISNINAFSSSQITKDATLATYTASVNSKFDSVANSTSSLNAFSASQLIKDTTLASVTASLQQQLTNIGAQSGSWVTESETGSFARTDVTNTFIQPQIISAAVTASAAKIANLNYPTTDGTFTGQVLQTNAAGTLSFGNVGAMYQTVHNGEATSLTVGTAVYVSGSQGANPVVYRAVTTDSTKMPAQYIISETIASGANGRGLLLGILEGYNAGSLPAGTQLYVDGNGVLTSTRPTGSNDVIQPIAIVTKTGAGGQLSVLNPGPVLLPNLQTGYAWVGNGNNQPLQVATSSFGGGGSADLTSLNAFTASQETKNTTLANVTSSLQAFTSSQNTINTNIATSASLYNTKWDNIAAQSGSWGMTSGSVPAGTVSSSAQIVGLGFLQTSSFEAYTASQDTKNSTLASYTASVNISLNNINAFTQSIIGTNPWTASIDTKFATLASQSGSWLNVPLDSLNAFTASQNTKNSTLGALTGSLFQTASFTNNRIALTKVDGGSTNLDGIATTGSNQFQGNQFILNGELKIAANANLSGSQYTGTTIYFDTTTYPNDVYGGYSINGNGDNGLGGFIVNTYGDLGNTPNIYFYGGGNNQFGSQNFFGLSPNNGNATFFKDTNFFTGSVSVSGSTYINNLTASLQQGYLWVGNANGKTTTVATSSFATTGANTFVGNQVLTGSLVISSSAAVDLQVTGAIGASGNIVSSGSTGQVVVSNTAVTITSNAVTASATYGRFGMLQRSGSNQIGMSGNPTQGSYVTGVTNPCIFILSGSILNGANYAPIQFQPGDQYTDGRTIFTTPIVGLANLELTGSLSLSGSAYGNVVSMSVNSNTASMDFSKGNYFELTASVSPIRIEVSNLRGGVTSTLSLIATTGSTIAFSSNVQQPSGSAYTASVSGSNDILSFVAFNSSKVNVVSTLKMI